MIKYFNMTILCCLLPVKLSIPPHRNRFTSTLHITNRHGFEFEINNAIKTDSNKFYTGSEKEIVKNENSFSELYK
jgi:hypothetical protein